MRAKLSSPNRDIPDLDASQSCHWQSSGFYLLTQLNRDRAGMIVWTEDLDFEGIAMGSHQVISGEKILNKRLIRIVCPSG